MSNRGGIYEGPGGQKLYGDGREVDPVKSLDWYGSEDFGEFERLNAAIFELAGKYKLEAPLIDTLLYDVRSMLNQAKYAAKEAFEKRKK